MSAQKILRLVGNVVRQTGQTLDAIGLKVQGKYGYKEGGTIQKKNPLSACWVAVSMTVCPHYLDLHHLNDTLHCKWNFIAARRFPACIPSGSDVPFCSRYIWTIAYPVFSATVPTHQILQSYQGKRPTLGPGAFVAPNASVIGDVKLGSNSSVWYGAVLRGRLKSMLCN